MDQQEVIVNEYIKRIVKLELEKEYDKIVEHLQELMYCYGKRVVHGEGHQAKLDKCFSETQTMIWKFAFLKENTVNELKDKIRKAKNVEELHE